MQKKFKIQGEDRSLEITMFLERESRNQRQIRGENLFFFLHLFLDKISFHIRKVLENQDSGKSRKIWAKLYCSPQIFLAGRLTLWSRSQIINKNSVD